MRQNQAHVQPGFVSSDPMATKKTSTAAEAPGASAYVLRIQLRGTKPAIWREVWVDAAITLRQLHHIIQSAMGWEEAHLHGFAVPGSGRAGRYWGIAPQLRYEPPSADMDFGDPSPDDARVRLAQLLRAPKDKLLYLYDYGDDWEHLVALKKIITTAEPLPLLVGAAETYPPEDCGGVHGYYELADALADPQHPQHGELSEWYEGEKPGPLDQAAFDALADAVKVLRVTPKPRRVR